MVARPGHTGLSGQPWIAQAAKSRPVPPPLCPHIWLWARPGGRTSTIRSRERSPESSIRDTYHASSSARGDLALMLLAASHPPRIRSRSGL